MVVQPSVGNPEDRFFLTTRLIFVFNYRCLHKTGGCLPFSPGKSCQVIGACMRLHNRCMELGLPLPDIEDVADEHDDAVISIRENATAQILRKNLINNFQ